MHGNRSQAQRTDALSGFKQGRFRVLVATDIVARGIDIEALSHVVNFDVPNTPDDYIHRVGRTARAELTGDAYTLVAPEEEVGIKAIERALGRPIERRWLDAFDYRAAQHEVLEIPLAERMATLRAQKKEQRSRATANRERKANAEAQRAAAEVRKPTTVKANRTRAGAPATSGQHDRPGAPRKRRRRVRGGFAPERWSA
jgi:ATP-dependent RNA helicase RhlE